MGDIPVLSFADQYVKTISAKNAAALDKDLMSVGAFSLDQLMELAGLSVSQAGNSTSRLRRDVPTDC